MARQREREAGAAPRDGRKRRLERCEARLVGGEDDRAAEVDGERGVAGGVCLSQRAIDRGPQLAARRPALVLCRVDELAADCVPAGDIRPLSRSTAGATSWPPAVCLRCHPPVRSTISSASPNESAPARCAAVYQPAWVRRDRELLPRCA